MPNTRELKLKLISSKKNRIFILASVNDADFSTSLWFEGVDFEALECKFGQKSMQNIYFHCAAFEINKLLSLAPTHVDFGEYTEFVTEEFKILWKTIHHYVWGEWRYRNNLPEYTCPDFEHSKGQTDSSFNIERPHLGEKYLLFCGGGKDSLVAARTLDRLGKDYTAFAYSSSVYGTAHSQHKLIQDMIQCTNASSTLKLWHYDDLLDAPMESIHSNFGVKSITAAETPSSIFNSIPFLLQNDLNHVVLGHEKSADTGNLIWDKTGEEINHQWGKSYEAQHMLNAYVKKHLIQDFSYFSLLKPIYDLNIFGLLKKDEASLSKTHSCNVSKPWCKRCSKCCYVWLNYMAYLNVNNVGSIFNENLFDVEENLEHFAELLGLREHTPFECVGGIQESRLAFEVCRKKGLNGLAMKLYENEAILDDPRSVVEKYSKVDLDCEFPTSLNQDVFSYFSVNAEKNKKDLINQLGL